MTLIDRYVGEVARRLPRRQRTDVSKELRSSIHDALEGRGADATSEEAVVAVLRELGSPEAVAAQYRPASGHLIGPAWYPTFSLVLRIYAIALLGWLVGALAIAAFVPSIDFGAAFRGVLGDVVDVALFAFAVIVLIFHLLDRAEIEPRVPRGDWDPRSLPAVREVDRVGRGESATAFAATAVALVVLQPFRGVVGLPPGSGVPLLLHDILRAFVPWLVVWCVLELALQALLIVQGRWHAYSRIASIVLDVFLVYTFYLGAAAVAAQAPAMAALGLPQGFVSWLALNVWLVPAIAAAVVLFLAVRSVRAMLQRDEASSPAERSLETREHTP